MERIQGLKEYVQTEHYLEGIGIGKEEQKEIQIAYQPLAQGEYNINYWFVHPLTGKKLVLRVNTGSQMHLENQIGYECHALQLLEAVINIILSLCKHCIFFFLFIRKI